MRFGAVPTMMLFVVTGFFACVPPSRLTETTPRSGGSAVSTSGGTTSTSGGTTSSSGGATSSSGGTTSTAGGTTSTAGTTTSSSGGTTTSSSGGTTARGGAGGSGGTNAAGGTTSAGGTASRGGSGGTATSAGGSTGICTDTAPPDNPCASWKSWGQCSISYLVDNNYCNQTCGRCGGPGAGGTTNSGGSSARGGAGGSGAGGTASSGGVTGAGGSSAAGGTATGPGSTNPQITGTNGITTRYWDCCKPGCGWKDNSNPPVPSCAKDGTTRIGVDDKNGCEGGGTAFQCYDFSPWYDASTNMAYGFAAFGSNSDCGKCFRLQFTGTGSGSNKGAEALKGQQMVVQSINTGDIGNNHFDLLIPGGGVGANTSGCTAQWGSSVDLGSTRGGLLSECNGDATCMKGKCASAFGNVSSVLRAGCDWFTAWFSSADNPNVVYKQVSCPSQLTGKTNLSK